jgi:glycosyltransferase involved in cell wall biosynthesis
MSYAPFRSETIADLRDSSEKPNAFHSPPFAGRSARNGKTKISASRLRKGHRDGNYSIIVHSHLCWDWVWQRPQQFLSRLSWRHEVLFVEMLKPDPELAAPLARFRTPKDFPRVTVLTMQFPAWRWNAGAYVDAERRRLAWDFLAGPGKGRFENPVQWFYDPMAAPAFAGQMNERLTVYDCMDELSKFRYAPPEIIERERALLARADVVFTGGRGLWEAKSRLHHNCHFYGCGVDGDHFGQARAAATQLAVELAHLPEPVLGYFGVVDERLDYELLARLAKENPRWSVVMVGPVLKLEARELPQQPNLHWLGRRAYEELPGLAKGFDLCLMPFALNEATEFINPTKALEYMATGRPIVSTAVRDVARNFGSVVKIAGGPGDFIALCREAVAHPDNRAVARGLKMVAENSWDSIVAKLEGHIGDALECGGRRNGTLAPVTVNGRKKARRAATRFSPPVGEQRQAA